MKSRGSVEFSQMPEFQVLGGGAVLSRRFAVNEGSISNWKSGLRVPSRLKRKSIHAAGGPHPDAWDELLPEEQIRRQAPVVDAEEASPAATRRLADELQAMVQQEIAALKGASEEIPGSRVQALSKLSDSAAKLGKLTGAGVLSERAILSSPVWQEIERSIADALSQWPDAMAAVATALEELRA